MLEKSTIHLEKFLNLQKKYYCKQENLTTKEIYEIFDGVVDFIEKEPQFWDQKRWHGNGRHCFIGLIEVIFGLPLSSSFCRINVHPVMLQISDSQFDDLSHYGNTLEEIKSIIEQIKTSKK